MRTFPPLPVWQTLQLETNRRPRGHITDPMQPNNPSKPPRIERWRLRLQEYDFLVV